MNKHKKGFSLVEAVIALTVIVIVSVSAMTIVLSSISARQKAINKAEAQCFADNAWECFKASNTAEEFVNNMVYTGAVVETDFADTDSSDSGYIYTIEKSNFTAVIKLHYALRPTFTMEVKDGEKTICSIPLYKKDSGTKLQEARRMTEIVKNVFYRNGTNGTNIKGRVEDAFKGTGWTVNYDSGSGGGGTLVCISETSSLCVKCNYSTIGGNLTVTAYDNAEGGGDPIETYRTEKKQG